MGSRDHVTLCFQQSGRSWESPAPHEGSKATLPDIHVTRTTPRPIVSGGSTDRSGAGEDGEDGEDGELSEDGGLYANQTNSAPAGPERRQFPSGLLLAELNKRNGGSYLFFP